MRDRLFILALVIVCIPIGIHAEGLDTNIDLIRPYDENADATAELDFAISQARANGKLVLINFGANWCPDCREFEKACLTEETKKLIDAHFVVAKVDVGDWDKNPELVAAWDNPIAGGIPAVVLATPDRKILFTTKAGQLSKARNMGVASLHRFFLQLASLDDPALPAREGKSEGKE
jgi:thioredoxin 1